MADLERAIRIARDAHAGQTDKGGHPYIEHPLRLMERCDSEDERIAAVLHDVVEDSDWTLDALKREGFAPKIIAALDCLTKRPGEKYGEFIRRVRRNDLARAVKIQDLLDNSDLSRLAQPTAKDQKRREKYRRALATLRPRGSRKHVLDWVESKGFREQLKGLISESGAELDGWILPKSHAEPEEARLDKLDPDLVPFDQEELASWWLAHRSRANTPNWDLAASARVGERAALVLVEAKAHESELSSAGKPSPRSGSSRSKENDERIGAAIDQANKALRRRAPSIRISKSRCYQLSNRIAFSWKLASMGVPVVLLYLGFTGDSGMPVPLQDAEHWNRLVSKHAGELGCAELIGKSTSCGPAPFWFLVSAHPVMTVSPSPV